MKSKFLSVLTLAVINTIILHAIGLEMNSQSSIYIYGKVTTHEGEVYQGQIRWGDEEAFWFDMFNSSKPENQNLKWLTDEEIEALNKNENKGWSIWGNNSWSYSNNDNTHIFACQFGDIQSLKPLRRSKVILEMKNGEVYKLEGGSNDVGAKIQVFDEEIGTIKIDWDNIEIVEFMETPSRLQAQGGDPLYGTVVTTTESFTGFLQWDHDERLSKDELNGETDGGDLDIEFGNIKSIERSGSRAAKVTLKSGRTYRLSGTNDVNSDNRGIIVNIPDQGRVDIEWDDFVEMTIEDNYPKVDISYNSFWGEKKIEGEILTLNGKKYSGQIVYDLDEAFQLEMLDGKVDEIEYMIPFSKIRNITPHNREETYVTLKDGKEFLLEDKVDVSEDNDGILVFSSPRDYDYIPWKQIEKITFDN